MDDHDALSSPAPLRAPAFEVAGEDGRVRARLGPAADGSLALDLADADRLVRVTPDERGAAACTFPGCPSPDAQRRMSAPAGKLRR